MYVNIKKHFFSLCQNMLSAVIVCQNINSFKFVDQSITPSGNPLFCQNQILPNCVWQSITFLMYAGHVTFSLNVLGEKRCLVLWQIRAPSNFLCLIVSVKICPFYLAESQDFFVWQNKISPLTLGLCLYCSQILVQTMTFTLGQDQAPHFIAFQSL